MQPLTFNVHYPVFYFVPGFLGVEYQIIESIAVFFSVHHPVFQGILPLYSGARSPHFPGSPPTFSVFVAPVSAGFVSEERISDT